VGQQNSRYNSIMEETVGICGLDTAIGICRKLSFCCDYFCRY